MAFLVSLRVRPRPTPGEYADVMTAIEVGEDPAVLDAALEEWVAARQGCAPRLQESSEFGRHDNVEAETELVPGKQTSRPLFRLDRLEAADDTTEKLALPFEEPHGIAQLARLAENGLDVGLFHILTFT